MSFHSHHATVLSGTVRTEPVVSMNDVVFASPTQSGAATCCLHSSTAQPVPEDALDQGCRHSVKPGEIPVAVEGPLPHMPRPAPGASSLHGCPSVPRVEGEHCFDRIRRFSSIHLESWVLRKIAPEGSVFPNALIAWDVDGDDMEEVIVGTTEGDLFVLKPDCQEPIFSCTVAATIAVVLYSPALCRLVFVTLEGQCQVMDDFLTPSLAAGSGASGEDGCRLSFPSSTAPPQKGMRYSSTQVSLSATVDATRRVAEATVAGATAKAETVDVGALTDSTHRLSLFKPAAVRQSDSVKMKSYSTAGHDSKDPSYLSKSNGSPIHPFVQQSTSFTRGSATCKPTVTCVFHVPSNCMCGSLGSEGNRDSLFLGSYDGRLYVYSLRTGACLATVFLHSPVYSLRCVSAPLPSSAREREADQKDCDGDGAGRPSSPVVSSPIMENHLQLLLIATKQCIALLPATAADVAGWKAQEEASGHSLRLATTEAECRHPRSTTGNITTVSAVREDDGGDARGPLVTAAAQHVGEHTSSLESSKAQAWGRPPEYNSDWTSPSAQLSPLWVLNLGPRCGDSGESMSQPTSYARRGMPQPHAVTNTSLTPCTSPQAVASQPLAADNEKEVYDKSSFCPLAGQTSTPSRPEHSDSCKPDHPRTQEPTSARRDGPTFFESDEMRKVLEQMHLPISMDVAVGTDHFQAIIASEDGRAMMLSFSFRPASEEESTLPSSLACGAPSTDDDGTANTSHGTRRRVTPKWSYYRSHVYHVSPFLSPSRVSTQRRCPSNPAEADTSVCRSASLASYPANVVLVVECRWCGNLGGSPLVQRAHIFRVDVNDFYAVLVAACGICYVINAAICAAVVCTIRPDCSSFTLMVGASNAFPWGRGHGHSFNTRDRATSVCTYGARGATVAPPCFHQGMTAGALSLVCVSPDELCIYSLGDMHSPHMYSLHTPETETSFNDGADTGQASNGKSSTKSSPHSPVLGYSNSGEWLDVADERALFLELGTAVMRLEGKANAEQIDPAERILCAKQLVTAGYTAEEWRQLEHLASK